ncbi:MAG: hypothetical protein ACOY0T_39870 [Myxococcota bacterium]
MSETGSKPARPKWALLLEVLALLQALVFAAAALSFTLAPAEVERMARPHVIRMVQAEALERYPALRSLSNFWGLSAALRADASETRELIDSKLPDEVARIFSKLCRHDCLGLTDAESIRSGLRGTLASLGVALDRVEEWARGRYGDLVRHVISDLAIVCATNALLLALAAAALHWGHAARAVRWIVLVLLATAGFASYLYFVKQDWLVTLVFADYVGTGYLVWCAVIAAVLCDCIFNRARILRSLLSVVAIQ